MDYKQIIALMIPIFVDQAFIVLMSFLNTAMVSSSGVAAISAVSLVDSLNMFIISLFIAVATGGTVIVAQYKGSGNPGMVSQAASQTSSMVTLISILISTAVIIFHLSALNFLFGNVEADVFQNAKIYLIGSCISFPFYAIYQAVTSVLRGVGETKASLGLSVILNLTYFCLNVVFITILDMGVMGLAISSITARILGMSASLLYLLRYNQTLRFKIIHAFKLNYALLKKIMYIGIPFAAEQMFFNGGKLLTQTFIVQLGTLSLTVNAISNSMATLFQIGGNAISITVITVVGQSIGSKNIADARKFVKSFIGLSSVLFIIAAAIILPLFPIIIKLYSPPAEIVQEIFFLIVCVAIIQPFVWAFSFTVPAALRAAGDSKFTSVVSMSTMWLIRILLGYYLGIHLQYGVTGVWIAMMIEWTTRGLIFTWRFKGDKWYRHKLI